LSSPLIPSSYTIQIEKEDGIYLTVLLEETAGGDQPYVGIQIGTLYEELKRKTSVEGATLELAARLEAYAATLRRMAPCLPAPMETP
jgi:hypothetical protein